MQRTPLAAIALIVSLVGVGCGGDEKSDRPAGAGNGTAYGLRKAGLVRCAGPVRGKGGAEISVYAEKGFAAVLASGAAATEDAIDLAAVRTKSDLRRNAKADAAARERSWRKTAFRALSHADTPSQPCSTGLNRLPVLAETEVPCADEILIPFGRKSAEDRFIEVLGTLYQVNVKLVRKGRRYSKYGGYDTGHDEQEVETSHPYCREL